MKMKIEFVNGNTENKPEVRCALANEISQYEMITDILHACCRLSQRNSVVIDASAPYLIANGKTLEVHEGRTGFFTEEEPFDIDGDDDDHAFITLKKEKNGYTVVTYYGNGHCDITSKQCVPYNGEKFVKIEERNDDHYIMSAEDTSKKEIIDEMIDEAEHTFADDIESTIKILETAKNADIDVSVSAYGEYEMFEATVKENYFSYGDRVFYKKIRL